MIDQRFRERAQFFSHANRLVRWHKRDEWADGFTQWVIVEDVLGMVYDHRPTSDMPDHAWEMAEAMDFTWTFEYHHLQSGEIISQAKYDAIEEGITHDNEYDDWRESMDDDEEYQWLNSSDAAWE